MIIALKKNDLTTCFDHLCLFVSSTIGKQTKTMLICFNPNIKNQ